MKAMQCELCGCADIVKDGDFFVCQGCGTKYTPENAKKMMVEGIVQVEGTVKVDASNQIANWLELGEKAFTGENYADAESYASRVLEHDSKNCRAWLLKGKSVGRQGRVASPRLTEAFSCFSTALENSQGGEAEEIEALTKEVSLEASVLCVGLVGISLDHYSQNPLDQSRRECVFSNLQLAIDVWDSIADKSTVSTTTLNTGLTKIVGEKASEIYLASIKQVEVRMAAWIKASDKAIEAGVGGQMKETFHKSFNDIYQEHASVCRDCIKLLRIVDDLRVLLPTSKAAILMIGTGAADFLIQHDESMSFQQKEDLYEEASKWNDTLRGMSMMIPGVRIIEISRPAQKTQSTSGGCYVATAVYGSYDCPQVWTLRRYRDFELAQSFWGRAFIKTYYAISPTLVKWFGHTDWFKRMWRGKLDRMVGDLQARGFSDKPYQDRSW
jgi:tetratricopeptide (TPR) repeat protein